MLLSVLAASYCVVGYCSVSLSHLSSRSSIIFTMVLLLLLLLPILFLVDSPLLHQILDILVETKKTSSKNGSSLNQECVECFGSSLILKDSISMCLSDVCFDQVRVFVRTFTLKMHALFKDEKFAEVEYVQPLSFELFKESSLVVLSEYEPNVRFERKTFCVVDTKYSTTLNPSGKIVKVSGETDTTMLYCGVPIMTWEDKRLDKKASTIEEIGQPLAEISGMGEKFQTQVGVQAPKFCGVLTTGLIWTVSYRAYRRNGHIVFGNTVPISTWNEDRNALDDDGLDTVTSLLITSLRSTEVLIKIIDANNKKLSSVEEYVPDTDDLPSGSDEDDDESGGGNGGGGGNGRGRSGVMEAVSKSLSNLSTPSATESATDSRVEEASKKCSSRRTPLAAIDMNSIVTFENMVKHDNLLQRRSVLHCMKIGNA